MILSAVVAVLIFESIYISLGHISSSDEFDAKIVKLSTIDISLISSTENPYNSNTKFSLNHLNQKCNATTCLECVSTNCVWCDTTKESPQEKPGCLPYLILCRIAHGVANQCATTIIEHRSPSLGAPNSLYSLSSALLSGIIFLNFF